MSSQPAPLMGALSPADQLRYARQILQLETQAIESVASRLDTEFCRAVDHLHACTGNIIVSGMGKAGLIGQKITATLASTGTRAHYLHPAEAVHGDLGRIHRDDLVLMLSQSGETPEIVRLLPVLAEQRTEIIAITCRRTSTLGRAALVTLDLGPLKEACHLGLAPSTSTTAMLAMGDALALVVSQMRNFAREDFARFHPGGSLGQKLAKVEEYMRPLPDCRVANCHQTVREVLVGSKLPGRRTGAVMVVDPQGILRGLFTDSDLAKLFEDRRENCLDDSIRGVMTKNPTSAPQGAMMVDAVEIMAERKISELPVVDADGRPLGLIDITDLVSLFPDEKTAVGSTAGAASVGPPRPKMLEVRKARGIDNPPR